MLSDLQKAAAWEDWLSAEVREQYFADLCGQYNARQRWSNFATLLLSSGAAVGFASSWTWPWVAPVLSLLAAAISAYLLVAQNIKSAIECADLSLRWSKLARQYRDLWMNPDRADADAMFQRADEGKSEASKSGASFPYDEKRITKWFDLVVANRVRPA